MNPPTHSEAQPRIPGQWSKLAWLPIPLLLIAISAARIAGLRYSYESHTLLLVLSFTFYTLVSLGTLYLIGRSFLASGSPGLLLLECGVLFWSLAGTVGDLVSHGDANINVTIFNTGILLAGLCHLAGTILAAGPQRVLRAKPLWLGAGWAFALAALWLVSQAALWGSLPVFFVPGHGGTAVRYCVLISAISLFVLSAGMLQANQRSVRLPFTSWYALALLLLAVGLFGVMIQLSLGSMVNWLSRAAQWLGGVYLLLAALASVRESRLPLLPPEKKFRPAYYRDAIAVAMVLTAVAIRLTFLSTLGMQAPFVTFYPAVMFAALYGGLRSGLVATALSAIFVDYFWIAPVGHLGIEQPSDWLAMLVFLLSGAMIAGVSDAMHSARIRASAAEKRALLAAERAAAAEALQEGRAKLEAALSSMTDAVFISDTEGRFIDFNDAFATFHRFKNKDECAKTLAEYPDILDVFMAKGEPAPLDQWAVTRALRGETATNAEYTLRRKDTGETWVGSYSFSPIRNKDGVIVGSVVAGRDITERKRAEDALRRSEKQYRELFENMIDGVAYCKMIFEKGKPQDFIYLSVNRAFETLTGLRNVVGKRVTEVIPGIRETDPEISEIFGRVSMTGKPERLELFVGALKMWFSLSVYSPEKEYFVAVFDVITGRKQAEANVIKLSNDLAMRNSELEGVNKELESFIYSVSHDLRTPLRTMSVFGGLLLKKYSERLDDQAKEHLGRISRSSAKLNRLVDDLLALSRLSRQEVNRMQVDLSALATSIVSELRETDPGRSVKVSIEDGLIASADPPLMEIALSNLIGNAWKFTSKTDDAHIEFGAVKDDGKTVYYVRDNGVGFDPEYTDKMFRPFHRLHSDDEFAGTGIGLAIVERVIHRHRGKAWAEGKLGKGATFSFILSGW